jgi:hypothetical protein
MPAYKLPQDYTQLQPDQRREVREQYIREQQGRCFYCAYPLSEEPPAFIRKMPINWKLFPPQFLKHPVHLQHDHVTNMTEGAVHAYCNAVLWQYEGR